MKRLLAAVVVLLPVVATSLLAQSLADVARKEEQRRKRVAKPAKVYTNKDLAHVDPAPGTSAVPGGDPAAAAAPAPGATPPAAAPDSQAAAAPDTRGAEQTDEEKRAADERAWRDRIGKARADLERTRMFAEALQTRANSLWADFTARDDPAQRSQIELERKKTLAELARTKEEVEAKTKAIADLEEDARRAGVPPGWLR